MAIDWGFAGQIGGFGFGLVFVVLIILAVAVWIVGKIISKASAPKGANNTEKEKGG
jgi:sodium pump decarboxylase gamma subunit